MEEVGEYLAWCLKQAEKGTILRLVGDVGGEVVANAQLTLWGRRAEIGSLVVAEAWRGRGIGSRLILALIEAARQEGASTLEIGVAQHDARTQRLYRRLGFSLRQEADPPVDASAQSVIYIVKEL
jgi:ribosomal protein S18 acetylase RimI-like enzyme